MVLYLPQRMECHYEWYDATHDYYVYLNAHYYAYLHAYKEGEKLILKQM